MDIFPRSTDHGTMDDRRAILIKAAKFAGVAFAAPLASAATPYVRLDSELGTLSDETSRIRHELQVIARNESVDPAPRTAVAIYATWANIDALRNVTNNEIAALKARTALYGAIVSTTAMDSANGKRWFDVAQRYARLAGDAELISLAHYHEAVSGIWWNDKPNTIACNMYLAGSYATNNEQQGLAHNIKATLAAQRGDRRTAVVAMEKAVQFASDRQNIPQADEWITPQAHVYAAAALSRFPGLLGAVDGHVQEALATIPANAHRLRAHALLALAQSRVEGREYDGAAQALISTLDRLPQDQLQPVLITRLRDIASKSDSRAMTPVRERLATMQPRT